LNTNKRQVFRGVRRPPWRNITQGRLDCAALLLHAMNTWGMSRAILSVCCLQDVDAPSRLFPLELSPHLRQLLTGELDIVCSVQIWVSNLIYIRLLTESVDLAVVMVWLDASEISRCRIDPWEPEPRSCAGQSDEHTSFRLRPILENKICVDMQLQYQVSSFLEVMRYDLWGTSPGVTTCTTNEPAHPCCESWY